MANLNLSDNNNKNIYQRLTIILENVQLILASMGIIGNMLQFAVFLRKPLKTHSYAFYYRIMSLTDAIVLVNLLRHWARIVLNVNVDLIGPLFCQFNEYVSCLVSSTSLWLRFMILFDRLIRVIYPAYFRILRRKWFQFISVLVIIVFSALIHIVLPFNQRLETLELELSNSSTSYLNCYLAPHAIGINLLATVANVGICGFIMFIFDLRLFSFIYKSRSRLRNGFYKPHSSVIKDRKFAVSSVGLGLNNFICVLIFTGCLFMAILLHLNPDQIQFFVSISLTAVAINCSSAFFVNLFINSIFYSEFLSLIGLKKTPFITIKFKRNRHKSNGV